ncbi:MAG: sensor histidine kinase, partial [Methylophilus sp.]
VAIVNKTKDKTPDIAASAQTIVAAANHIYDGMHNIIRQLRPAAMDNMGLIETLRDMVAGYQTQHTTLDIQLQVTGQFQPMGENVNINIYRIVQEAVNNAIKHAHAKSIKVHITSGSNDLLLTIIDDGVGMPEKEIDQTRHFGLLGMRERVQALHGQFKVVSQPDTGRGTMVEIRLPLQAA